MDHSLSSFPISSPKVKQYSNRPFLVVFKAFYLFMWGQVSRRVAHFNLRHYQRLHFAPNIYRSCQIMGPILSIGVIIFNVIKPHVLANLRPSSTAHYTCICPTLKWIQSTKLLVEEFINLGTLCLNISYIGSHYRLGWC